ncbi:hypothetical protein PSTG_12768 [Puccinia striiformis f. sp. tritici PST-78]|uniref:Uncharacterized protein n=1 Tax=Puccinia striiformis f. sp. tritici PST-78 TaxID=1165861 RepID=A0A0L0V3G2_9BASI|nr:hypothetical protein PSTG_12768 [Puccinia striiformis f. sp. tritici PST-78]
MPAWEVIRAERPHIVLLKGISSLAWSGTCGLGHRDPEGLASYNFWIQHHEKLPSSGPPRASRRPRDALYKSGLSSVHQVLWNS